MASRANRRAQGGGERSGWCLPPRACQPVLVLLGGVVESDRRSSLAPERREPAVPLDALAPLSTLGEADSNLVIRGKQFFRTCLSGTVHKVAISMSLNMKPGLKYSQLVNALQAVTVAVTSLPGRFSLFWSRGGEQQEALLRGDILGSCRNAV